MPAENLPGCTKQQPMGGPGAEDVMLPVCRCGGHIPGFFWIAVAATSHFAVASCAEAEEQHATQSATTVTHPLEALLVRPAGTPLQLWGRRQQHLQ